MICSEIKVSIFSITYNHEKYISHAIESFLMQKTNFKFEIVIADDASTDNNQSIIKDYNQQYPEIINPILREKNVGMNFNFSEGIKKCKGKYIALCEGDDYWTDPYKLQKQVDFLESHPDCSLTCHSVGVEMFGSDQIESRQIIIKDKYLTNTEIITYHGKITPTLSYVFKSSMIKKLPNWVTKAPVGDIPLAFFLMMHGNVYCFSDMMGVYRSNVPGSWSTRKIKRINRFKYRVKYNAFIQEFNKYSKHKYSNELNIHRRKRNFLSFLLIELSSFIYRSFKY